VKRRGRWALQSAARELSGASMTRTVPLAGSSLTSPITEMVPRYSGFVPPMTNTCALVSSRNHPPLLSRV
jgi:hypothetical protein